MDTEVLGRTKLEADAASAPRSSMGRAVRGRVDELLKELRRRSWGSETVASGLAFLELVATHGNPPDQLRPFRDALLAALSPRLTDAHRADRYRCAASLLTRRTMREPWALAAALILREYAASLHARPEARMELIQFCAQEMGFLPTHLDAALPRLASSPKSSGLAMVGLGELIDTQVQALCMSALREVCARQPYADWSMLDINAALFALRYHYVNIDARLCGEEATASQRQDDFRDAGLPLWEALRHAANRLAAKKHGCKPLKDDAWHERTQAAVFLAIGAAKSPFKPDTPTVLSRTDGPSRVICRRPIAPSSDRSDKEELERHRILERPLPLAGMPQRAEIEASHRRLLDEFPWAEDVLAIVFDDLIGRAAVGAATLAMSPTLLVGHPGSGKSRLARRVAEELCLPCLDLCLGGSSDTKMLGGTSRGWGTGKPSDLATLLATHQSASAIVILDELDKAHDRQRDAAGIQSYLLGLVEPETAARHNDAFLKTACDFSGVLWLATANALSDISVALLSRFRVLMLQQPRRQDFEVIARNVIADMASHWGVDQMAMPELRDLSLPWDQLTSARQVRLATEAAVTRWGRELQRH